MFQKDARGILVPKTNTSSSAKAGKTAALYRTAKAAMLPLILLCKTVFAIFCAFRRKLSYDFWDLFWKKPKTLLTNPKLCVILTKQNTKLYRGVEQLVARRAHNPEVRWFKSPPRNQKQFHSRYNFGYGILLFSPKTTNFDGFGAFFLL